MRGETRSRYDVLMIKDDEVAYFRARPRYEYHSDSFISFNVALYSENYSHSQSSARLLKDCKSLSEFIRDFMIPPSLRLYLTPLVIIRARPSWHSYIIEII